MNIKEFAALKPGDKITIAMNDHASGEVVEVTDSGVRVVWGARHAHETRFFYSVQGTAWFHWSMNEDSLDQALLDELAHPPKSIMKDG